MGSLVPGWNSAFPGVPPKDLQDHQDDSGTEKEGYFARYLRLKNKRKDAKAAQDQDAEAEPPALDRRSCSAAIDSTRVLKTQASLGSGGLEQVNRLSHLSITRTQTLPVDMLARRGSLAGDEDESWGSHSWGAGTSPTKGDLNRYKKQPREKADAWWRKFSSSHLNELAEESDASAWRKSPYLPQHGVAGQKLQYISTEPAGCGGAEQSTKDDAGNGLASPNLLPVH